MPRGHTTTTPLHSCARGGTRIGEPVGGSEQPSRPNDERNRADVDTARAGVLLIAFAQVEETDADAARRRARVRVVMSLLGHALERSRTE